MYLFAKFNLNSTKSEISARESKLVSTFSKQTVQKLVKIQNVFYQKDQTKCLPKNASHDRVTRIHLVYVRHQNNEH